MPVWCVTGKLGAGKTLVAVSRIQKYLNKNRRVATNLDLNLEKLINPLAKNTHVARIPDVPSIDDFHNIGLGYDGAFIGDEKNGLVVLDECAKWLNSRAWNDKNRKLLIDYFVHLRKKRWDLILIIQDVEALDKQFRDLYVEHIVYCSRSDRYNIPVIGGLLKLLNGGDRMPLPKVHIGQVFYCVGNGQQSHVENWIYRGTDIMSAYDTEQGFNEETSPGLNYFIPPFYTHGQFIGKYDNVKNLFKNLKTLHFFLIGALLGGTLLKATESSINNPQSGVWTCNEDWENLFGSCDIKPRDVKVMLAQYNDEIPEGGAPRSDAPPDEVSHILDNVRIGASVLNGSQYEYYFFKDDVEFDPTKFGYKIYDGKECNALALNLSDKEDRIELTCN